MVPCFCLGVLEFLYCYLLAAGVILTLVYVLEEMGL